MIFLRESSSQQTSFFLFRSTFGSLSIVVECTNAELARCMLDPVYALTTEKNRLHVVYCMYDVDDKYLKGDHYIQ